MKTSAKWITVSFVSAIIFLSGCGAGVRNRDLRCEYQTNPLGIDTPRPELFWKTESPDNTRGQRQTAYQVLVASDESLLKPDRADMWDSSKVLSSDSVHIPYAGKPLASDKTYFWKVRYWDQNGKASDWSAPAFWSMGLLDKSDWKAQWIGPVQKEDGSPYPLPIFRHDFAVEKAIKKAIVYITGLGHYELSLNGQKVGDQFLAQPWTKYEKTICYDTYDITDSLHKGQNCFGVMLGKGFYMCSPKTDRRVHCVDIINPLMLRLQASIEYKDDTKKTIVSDTSWKTTNGPITHSAINGGEDYDARKLQAGWNRSGFDDSSWSAVTKADPPTAAIISARNEPIKTFEVFKPVSIDQPETGHFVYNLGQNASAKPQLRIRGKAGQQFRLTPAEQRKGQTDNANNGTGVVNQAGSGKHHWEYTLRGGDEEIWSPQFTYTGFQYIELTGAVPRGFANPDNLPVVEELLSVHTRTAVAQSGQFECSNELFNRTDELIDWAVKSNMSHVLTDCPHREKLGWLEESHLMGPSVAWKYDMSRFFNKITMDIRDSQDTNGRIFTVAPSYFNFTDERFRYSPEWGAAGVLIPWQTWQWYGDKRCLRENYAMMKGYVDYMDNTSKGLIPKSGLGDWYDYEPGKNPGPSRFTPVEATAMVTFYMCTQTVEKTADILGNNTDSQHYVQLAERIKTKYNATWFDGTDTYQNKGSCQTTNGMSLAAGLVDPQYKQAVLNKIVEDIRARGNQQTSGDVGYTYLLTALRQMDRSDVIFDMANRTNIGSYGGILAKGWTSMPEAWDALLTSSMNHFMLGHIQQWFYESLAGIAPDPAQPGFKNIIIRPEVVGNLTWCRGQYESLYGTIRSEWKIQKGYLNLDITIPANSTATVYIPAKAQTDVVEGTLPASNAPGVQFLRMANGKAVFAVESGRYQFRTPRPVGKINN